jgi:hypothetical protein
MDEASELEIGELGVGFEWGNDDADAKRAEGVDGAIAHALGDMYGLQVRLEGSGGVAVSFEGAGSEELRGALARPSGILARLAWRRRTIKHHNGFNAKGPEKADAALQEVQILVAPVCAKLAQLARTQCGAPVQQAGGVNCNRPAGPFAQVCFP